MTASRDGADMIDDHHRVVHFIPIPPSTSSQVLPKNINTFEKITQRYIISNRNLKKKAIEFDRTTDEIRKKEKKKKRKKDVSEGERERERERERGRERDRETAAAAAAAAAAT